MVASAIGGLIALQIDRWTDRPRPLVDVVDRTVARSVSQGTLESPPDFRAAAKRIMPSVVSIDTVTTLAGWGGPRQSADTGSGLIYSADGLIVTNAHVVGNNPDQISVHLADGRSAPAQVVGVDSISDLAVLRINLPNLQPAELGKSSELEVGEWVIAVGNPLGQDHTLSVGVVSSLGRDLPTNRDGVLINAIQTDAAINPGNSGGPLTNAQGQVVGINSAILSTRGSGSIGIGFAIPMDSAVPILQDLIRFGRARYGQLGAVFYSNPYLLQSPMVRAEFQRNYGVDLPESGLMVSQSLPGTPAARAGIKPFDVLLKLDGKPLREQFDYMRVMARKRPGDKIKVTVWSAGETRELELTLIEVR